MIRNATMKMKYFPAILATSMASIRPATTQAFGFGFSDLMARPMVLFSPEHSLFQRESDFANRILQNSSPRFEVTNNDEKFQIAFDLPGLKPEDVNIRVEEGRRVLCIEGVRVKSGEGYSFSSKFSQSFSLDPSVEADKFEAQMKDGILLVSAPKDHARIEENARSIPISSGENEKLESSSAAGSEAEEGRDWCKSCLC